jgi:tRNA(fMet)-specific endonuclease VapC
MGRLRYLLDTNIISELSKANANRDVLAKFEQHRFVAALGAPVLHELKFGLLRLADGERRRHGVALLESLIDAGLETLPYDTAAALKHAEDRASFAAKGVTVPFVDGQIAAIAAVNDLALVTRNTTDFKPFAGLRVENWFKG